MHDVTRKLHAHLLECSAGKESFAATLAVSRQGRLIEQWMIGRTSEASQSDPIRADTRFLVASLSKPVSAAASMRLIDHKVVKLSTPVHKVLPEFKWVERARSKSGIF